MNIAVIFAGGVGQRMNISAKPKQFLELHGKPIIIYTLEKFEEHAEIDGIVIACVEPWIPYLWKLVERYSISKVKAIVRGGSSGQDSIYNGLKAAAEMYPEESIVLIHDAVRPVIGYDLISRNIQSVKEWGSGITVAPAIETITINTEEGGIVGDIINRSNCKMAKAPQSFILKDIMDAHMKAIAEGKHDFTDSACIMQAYGYKLHSVDGNSDNIKITTPVDFYTFKAIIDARENSQIFG